MATISMKYMPFLILSDSHEHIISYYIIIHKAYTDVLVTRENALYNIVHMKICYTTVDIVYRNFFPNYVLRMKYTFENYVILRNAYRTSYE